ncbi:MAG: hypothetical protein ACFCUU_09260 [Cyclobacteriaceae bacterium]
MKKFGIILLTFVWVCLSTTAFSQDEEDASLRNQYNELINKSNTYNEYKVIKITSMNQFWSSIQDSLNASHSKVGTLSQGNAQKAKTIDSLKLQMTQMQELVDNSEYEKEHLKVLGMYVQKDNFVITFWASIFLLIGLLVTAIMKFNNSNRITRNTLQEFDELSREFKEHKDIAREKEMKLKRELQTERNSIEEIMEKNAALQQQSIRKVN